MTQFDQVKFLRRLDWKLSPLFEASTTPVNELFEVFLATFAETVNQFAPKRKATRKREKSWAQTLDITRFIKIYPNEKQAIQTAAKKS